MKYFVDGDQLVITKDNFVDLQESPAVFYPLESEIAKTVLGASAIMALPIDDLMRIRDLLEMGGISTAAPDAAQPPCVECEYWHSKGMVCQRCFR